MIFFPFLVEGSTSIDEFSMAVISFQLFAFGFIDKDQR